MPPLIQNLTAYNINRTSTDEFDCFLRLRYETYPADYGYYVCGPIMLILIAIGLLGNLLCLCVLFKIRPIPIICYYTVPLCLCDCAVLFGSFLMTNLPHLLYGRMRTYGPYVELYPYLNFASNFAYTSCVWLVVLLSIERYFALCHPLKHKIYDAKSRSVYISIFALIFALLYNIPRYFEIRTFRCFEVSRRRVVSFMEPTSFRMYQAYWIAYKIIMGPLLFSFGPFLLLCVLSVRIWREVRKTRLMVLRRKSAFDTLEEKLESSISFPDQQLQLHRPLHESISVKKPSNQSTTSSSRQQRQQLQRSNLVDQRRILTYTLLCVVVKFLFCHSLPAVIDFCETFMSADEFQGRSMENLVDTSTLLVVLNSSLNVFVHAWCSGGFRRKMRNVFTPRSSVKSKSSMVLMG